MTPNPQDSAVALEVERAIREQAACSEMMTANGLLRAARARIEKPEHWTQSDFARTAVGYEISPRKAAAMSWCAAGALMASCERESEIHEAGSTFEAAALALEAEMCGHIYSFNDTHTHAEVLAAFDRAIQKTESNQ